MVKIIVTSFLVVFFIFAPALQVKAQWTVAVTANWSPTEIMQVQNSTNLLAEQMKQGWEQIHQTALSEANIQVKIAEYAKQAARWAETIKQYTNEIFQMARQFTSLKGILGLTMQKLGLDSEIMKTFKEWATALYAIIALKQQYEDLWQSRMVLFKNWWGRSKNGIFNPQQDWLDLQQYFLDGLGKRGYDYQMDVARMQILDTEFQMWKQEMEKLRADEALIQDHINKVILSINDQKDKVSIMSPVNVDDNSGAGTIDQQSTVTPTMVAQNELLLANLQKDLRDVRKDIQILLNKMNQRYTWYYLVYGKAIEDGDSVLEKNQGWETLYGIKFGDIGKLLDFGNGGAAADPTSVPAP